MNLLRGLNSYAEAVAILTYKTAGGFAPIPNEVPAKPPKDACDVQKGTDGETRYSQDSAWIYFMQKNHTGDNAIVEYTTNPNMANQFSRPLTIGIEIADAWCYSCEKDSFESGVMIFRRAPFIKIHGLMISKPQMHASRSEKDTIFFT